MERAGKVRTPGTCPDLNATRDVRPMDRDAMKSHDTWFVVLVVVCMAGPYLLGVRPRTQRHWRYVGLTVAFLAWILALMAPVGSHEVVPHLVEGGRESVMRHSGVPFHSSSLLTTRRLLASNLWTLAREKSSPSLLL